MRESCPASQIELTSFPLPAWTKLGVRRRRLVNLTRRFRAGRLRRPGARGRFELHLPQRRRSPPPQMCLLATTGGGVAVLDYDADGWPDVYFTQGGPWPWTTAGQSPVDRDRLYRNLGNGQFADVTQEAGLGDDRYSQGVAAGDFDNDGWPDLYVANFGANRLYRNGGDGTFTDVTGASGIAGERWTSSCLIADLNGDGQPDLYDVNYLSGKDAARSLCRKGEELRWCSPSSFPGEPDQVYLNRGEGRFEDVSDTAGILASGGKGLGIIAADFDGSGRLNLFVANDAEANFYFVNQTGQRGEPLAFEERALLAGLAYDGDGLPQASMGVALDDADGDGLLDLFVTSFHHESNTLYLQRAGRFVCRQHASSRPASSWFRLIEFRHAIPGQ